MDGKALSIAEIIKPARSTNYTIPPYQRQYEWNADRWQALISDVINAATAPEGNPPHWMGILLISSDSNNNFPGDHGSHNYAIIDGQQRTVTLLIWLAALVHHAKSVNQICNLDLTQLSKVAVQQIDQKPLEIVFNEQWLDPQWDQIQESRILEAYRYFRFILWLGANAISEENKIPMPKWKSVKNKGELISHWQKFLENPKNSSIPRKGSYKVQELIDATLNKLSIFCLLHVQQNDEQVEIVFDTLNGMRQELEPLDHVRNSLFVKLGPLEANKIYSSKWAPAEDLIRDVRLKGLKPGSSFLYDYLIAKGEKRRQGTINRNRGASHLARMTAGLNAEKLKDLISNDLIPSMSCWTVVIRRRDSVVIDGVETNFSSRSLELLDSIRDLSTNPMNPLLLHYLVARVKGKLSDSQLEEILFIIETYLARQMLILAPMSPLRARIMEVAAEINGSVDAKHLIKAFEKSGIPTDKEILAIAKEADYGMALQPKSIGALFRGIERKLSGKGANNFKIGNDHYTIEHIYPKKNAKWLKDLSKWRTSPEKMQLVLNNFGNLTVVTKEHNSKVGNKTLKEKQTYPSNKVQMAPLKIHDGWLNANSWTEKDIEARTKKLIQLACDYWSVP